ncbi:MAG: malate synthase G [Xanthomonadales bacterium]|nr:malate synthase G [Xanthomonadales bacterium]
MESRIECSGLSVAKELYNLVAEEIAPGTGIEPAEFWAAYADIVEHMVPANHFLLEKRDRMHDQMNAYYREHPGQPDMRRYKAFLRQIGYLVPEGGSFEITTENVDPEIARVAGPQLVVPVSNARFALNAANARWGSLYDALYGTDMIPEDDGLEQGTSFNPARGEKVIESACEMLDLIVPLAAGAHRDVTDYVVRQAEEGADLSIELADGTATTLTHPGQFAGYSDGESGRRVLLSSNHLHIELQLDRGHPIGRMSRSGLKDVMLESALTAIQDCEDSVAAVDTGDKVRVYRNWLGLMKGDLEETFQKNGKTITRKLNPDRRYTAPDGSALTLPGRSLQLVRNVGHLMTTDAVRDHDDNETPEGIMDGMITVLCAMHDLRGNPRHRNSRAGSVYIVKPKMRGPREVRFADRLFDRIEDAFGLPRSTIKIGVMDEERRTTTNLKECIRAVADRIVFINTGFLDRTGDEIHTSMLAGPMLPKGEIKDQPWIQAYEQQNVDIGLECGFRGKAQIGKGMWAMPDEMRAMYDTKMAHLEAGANCAWVPSPTAATLHALHYMQYDVNKRQKELMSRERASLDDILTPPLLDRELSAEEIQAELDNNAQGILGYVVRWIDQGIGCSKVPDINDVGLMEDRATLRISSLHMCNWLLHGICSEEQVMDTLRRMAKVVDEQNAGDPNYRNMAPNYDESVAFKAACDLVFLGREQPSGFTEPLLHRWRVVAKRRG